MSGLNEEEAEVFLKECKDSHKEDTQFLLEHGWTHKHGTIWVSPKGEEFSHDLGFVGDHTLAINKAKHDIVIDKGFIQFKVQIFMDIDDFVNSVWSDLFFPCIKDGTIYFYTEAVSIAVYSDSDYRYDSERWLVLKQFLLENFDVKSINHNDTINVIEHYDFETKKCNYRSALH